MTQITQALERLFDRHRIVFWYDAKLELRAEFDAVAMDGVEKIVLDNNQFSVKYRILRQEPEKRFLLYHAGPPPADPDNWLLDVQLAHGEFRADQTALWLSELGLGPEFMQVIQPHIEFFQSSRRREQLKNLLKADDTPYRLRLKMMAVCAAADAHLEYILQSLLSELAAGKDERIRLIQRFGLDTFLWEQLERYYGYRSTNPGMRDFAIELFKSCYALSLGEDAQLTNDALVFLKRWKDSLQEHEAFEILSAQCAEILGIEQDLESREMRELVESDVFELIDRKILSELARATAARTITAGQCEQIVRQRRMRHWFNRYKHPYEAIETAARFFHLLSTVDLTIHSFDEGIQQYSRGWFQLDQLYRHFIYHAQSSRQTTLLDELSEQVENFYTNQYLLPLNDNWQQWVDACERWEASTAIAQQDFYDLCVRPYLSKNNKVFVIICDALRYEIAEELARLIRQEDRYEATLRPGLSMLPSYTKLGMAALLPHTTLAFTDDGETVLADATSTQSTENRRKILERALPGRATVLTSDDFFTLNRDESRALFRDHDVVYVYHTYIDNIGDKRATEEQVFGAVAQSLELLVTMIKKLAGANATNFLVTADHGFIYQHRALDDSDFAALEPEEGQIAVRNRRFVLGRGLARSASFKRFTSAQIGYHTDLEILLPKSINRLRVSGSGSRYVHGGAALQEVVIPILQIHKKRVSDTSIVEVDIIRGTTSTITAGQLTVAFYQTEPTSEKLQPRKLRIGIYTNAGELISDVHELTFDFTSENPREREQRVQFILTSKADAANGQEVILRLDEQIGETSHMREYKSVRYTLRRSFTSDFDF
jgi:uncharacterized protein (TIGR02687 family)